LVTALSELWSNCKWPSTFYFISLFSQFFDFTNIRGVYLLEKRSYTTKKQVFPSVKIECLCQNKFKIKDVDLKNLKVISNLK
jgi:hypothetical protein